MSPQLPTPSRGLPTAVLAPCTSPHPCKLHRFPTSATVLPVGLRWERWRFSTSGLGRRSSDAKTVHGGAQQAVLALAPTTASHTKNPRQGVLSKTLPSTQTTGPAMPKGPLLANELSEVVEQRTGHRKRNGHPSSAGTFAGRLTAQVAWSSDRWT